MNAVVPACAISRIRTITSLSKEMRGNYTTFAPEQTSRLIRYYAAERESVTADIGLHIDVYHGIFDYSPRDD